MKIVLLIILIGVVLCAALILVCNVFVNTYSRNRLYTDVNDIPEREYGLLLGTSKVAHYGGPNEHFIHRVNAAAELYNAGKVKKIFISGDVYDREGYGHIDEPVEMQNALMEQGVPKEAIILDPKGYRTLESVKNISKLGVPTFTVISQKFHNQRCIYQAEHYGLPLHDIIGYNAPDAHSRYSKVVKLRELLARVKVFVDLAKR